MSSVAESKIDLVERLRHDGVWPQASVWKDKHVKELRDRGLKRREATEQAWADLGVMCPQCLSLPRSLVEQVTWEREPRVSADELQVAVDEFFSEQPDLAAAIGGLLECVAWSRAIHLWRAERRLADDVRNDPDEADFVPEPHPGPPPHRLAAIIAQVTDYDVITALLEGIRDKLQNGKLAG